MLKEERHIKILALLDEHETITVSNLAKEINVVEMTIRRDLNELAEQGKLIKIHGGAKRIQTQFYDELSHQKKLNMNMDEKQEIAEKCRDLIAEQQTIFIGSGTTTGLIAKLITDIPNLTVVTNSLFVFQYLVRFDTIEVILTGGKFRKKTGTFVGFLSNEVLKSIRVDIAFIGSNGIHENDITTASEDEALSNQIILDNAQKKIVVADYTKFQTTAFYKFYDTSNLTGIVTDSKLSEKQCKHYQTLTKVY